MEVKLHNPRSPSSVIVVLEPPSSNLDPTPTFAVFLHLSHRPVAAFFITGSG
jgi:hypothetical protein